MYSFLNYFFFVFHTALILFNTFGYLFEKTRRLNLITLSLTAFSWFVLGIWYGWGFCFCTEWHWQVREHLGIFDNDASYIQFLARRLTGIDFPQKTVDIVTAAVFFVSFGLSIFLNVKSRRKARR
ncbi:MAG: DUF2784 family protein [Bacteroidia bacterium]|jgi:hypothetical protein|nr:DUF2784 family protein [Bacteroidia bacterium]